MKRVGAALLLAVVLGFGIGLYYAWVVAPQRIADLTPAALRADFKENYRIAIASAYAATGNLDRARARLALLGDADPVSELTSQAQRSLAAGQSDQISEDLARLAADLGTGASSVGKSPFMQVDEATPSAIPVQVPSVPTTFAATSLPGGSAELPTAITSQPETSIPPPSPTPVPTANSPFVLLSQDEVCNANLTSGLLQVTVLDHDRRPMPGVEITIIWDAGEEHIFTGLKPEISLGYADFVMQPGTAYSLLVARAGSPVSGLSSPTCPVSGNQSYVGGLKLSFRQP
jgi:hypothetical protein